MHEPVRGGSNVNTGVGLVGPEGAGHTNYKMVVLLMWFEPLAECTSSRSITGGKRLSVWPRTTRRTPYERLPGEERCEGLDWVVSVRRIVHSRPRYRRCCRCALS